MNLRQFIKNYWAALGGAVLLLWLEFQMDWVGFPYGDEAQKTVNILLLVASFISVLTSNGRDEQRKVELLQIVVLVCEAYLVNVDVFSKPLRQWSDLLYGWNLAWNICGVLELFLVSGLLCRALCGLLQSVRYLLEHLKELVRWLEQTIRQCDKGNLLEAAVWTVMLAIAFWLRLPQNRGNAEPLLQILLEMLLAWILVRAFRRGMLYYLCDRYGIHPDDLRILLLVVCMGIAFFVGIGLWKQGGSTSRNLLELLEDGVVTFEEELAAWRASIWSRT